MFIPFLNVPQVINGTTAGVTAQIQPDPFGTYFGLRLYYKRGGAAATPAQIASDLTEIRVLLNGTIQWQLTGAQLQMVNAVRGISPDNGEVPLWFMEPYRKTEQVQDRRSWGMVGIDQFTVEVDIAAGAVTPVLTAAKLWTPIPSVMGEIRKFKRVTVPISVTGDNTVSTLPRNDRILNLHCNTTILTNVKVKLNNNEQYNIDPARIHSLAKEFGYVPQTGWQHLAFDYRRRGAMFVESLDAFLDKDGKAIFPALTLLPLDITFTTSAATPFTMIRELSGPRD